MTATILAFTFFFLFYLRNRQEHITYSYSYLLRVCGYSCSNVLQRFICCSSFETTFTPIGPNFFIPYFVGIWSMDTVVPNLFLLNEVSIILTGFLDRPGQHMVVSDGYFMVPMAYMCGVSLESFCGRYRLALVLFLSWDSYYQ